MLSLSSDALSDQVLERVLSRSAPRHSVSNFIYIFLHSPVVKTKKQPSDIDDMSDQTKNYLGSERVPDLSSPRLLLAPTISGVSQNTLS